MDNSDSGDGDSNSSDEDNEARGCVGRRGLLTPITSQLKAKRAVKYYF